MQIAISEKDYDPKLTPIYFKFVSRIKMNNIVLVRVERDNKRIRLNISCRFKIRISIVMYGPDTTRSQYISLFL